MNLVKTREALDIVQFGTGVNRDSDFAEVRAELDAAESLLREVAALKVFAVAGLSAFHGRLCLMAGRGIPTPDDATKCQDPKCRAWAKAVQGETPDVVAVLRARCAAFESASDYDKERPAPASDEAHSLWAAILEKPHHALPLIQGILSVRDSARNAALEEAAERVGMKWECGGFGLMRRTDLEQVEAFIRALKRGG